MKFQESKASAQGGDHNQFARGGQRFGQRNGNFQPVRGEITSSDANSITVKMQDGSSKIVLLSDITAITEATSASKQSLTTGKQVMVIGSNGSITINSCLNSCYTFFNPLVINKLFSVSFNKMELS